MKPAWAVCAMVIAIAAGAFSAVQCAPDAPGEAARQRERAAPEAISARGDSLYAPALTSERRTTLEADLAVAKASVAANPDDPEATIWLGRRLAYLGRYRDAIAVYSRGIERWPGSYTLYRHRGHRWITVREFGRAVADLERATALIRGVPDAIEPDGAPNAANIPRSTSHSNIWYHLGVAYYVQGRFEDARRAFEECMHFSTNDDMRVATSDWLYMACRRLGREPDAQRVLEPIHRDMEILENRAYHRRLLMYKGLLAQDSLLASSATDLDLATQGYGLGNWMLCNGDTARAVEMFARVLAGSVWPAFGYIAAEADWVRFAARDAPTAAAVAVAVDLARTPVVGLPCENCEDVFVGMPAQLAAAVAIAPASEPGARMRIDGTVRDASGKPAAGIIVYAYHTDDRGLYPQLPESVPGRVRHGRLRAWALTDAHGRYRFDSIRPAGYPNTEIAAHVHMHIIEPNRCTYWIADILFDDDPRLSESERRRAASGRGGNGLTNPRRDDDGTWLVVRDIVLGEQVSGYPGQTAER